MKKLIMTLTLCIFTLNQALAYAPSQEEREINEAIEQISLALDHNKGAPKIMSERKFERKKRRTLKKLSNKIGHVETLSQSEQNEYLAIEVENSFHKIKRIANKFARKERLLRKMALRSGRNIQEVKAGLAKASDVKTKKQALEETRAKADELGGYEYLLKDKREKLQELTYNDYLKSAKRAPASKKSFQKSGWDDLTVAIWALVVLIGILFVTIGAYIMIIVALIAGMSLTPFIIPAAIGTGILLLFGV